MIIYSPKITNRLRYCTDFIFRQVLTVNFRLTSNIHEFLSGPEEKINYSTEKDLPGIYIKPGNLLFSENIESFIPDSEGARHQLVLFPNQSEIGFDIFSAVFYMISRYEEYLPFSPDIHKRFPASESLNVKLGISDLPIVDIWIMRLAAHLRERFRGFNPPGRTLNTILTYDIDVAYAYKQRGLVRNLASSAFDLTRLNFKRIRERLAVLILKTKDPWDIYSRLLKQIDEKKLKAIFFFLLGSYAEHNKNINPANKTFRKLIAHISDFHPVGIHPSYNSYNHKHKIVKEKNTLEEIIQKPVRRSRQHFLQMQMPITYQYLLEAGIKEEYTMGYAEIPGFRAGTCSPFYFFDLTRNAWTDLLLFPLTFMEGAYIKYLGQSPEKALVSITQLLEEVKTVNGTFISLWHNHTLSSDKTFEGWDDLHERVLDLLSENTNRS